MSGHKQKDPTATDVANAQEYAAQHIIDNDYNAKNFRPPGTPMTAQDWLADWNYKTDTGQAIGGGVVAYLAGGRELIGIASGMRSPTWPGGTQRSRIVVYGIK